LGLDLLQEVIVEALVDLAEQLRRGAQIDLGGADAHMSQVGSERRQAGIDVLAVAVPGEQAIDGKGVPLMPRAA